MKVEVPARATLLPEGKLANAGIAQLVEHDLAKVGVASSSLVSRSSLRRLPVPGPDPGIPPRIASPGRSPQDDASGPDKAGWQSGYAADCNSVYAGSIPTPASNPCTSVRCTLCSAAPTSIHHDPNTRPGGEIGRRKGLKIPRGKPRTGSIPVPGTSWLFLPESHEVPGCGTCILVPGTGTTSKG